jgi:autotransporter-associated beta strand protein
VKTNLLIVLGFTIVVTAQAGSATWNLNPTSGDWNTAANWTPATVPNGAVDNATFGVSNTVTVSLSVNTTVGSAIFTAGASAFTITNPGFSLTIDGPGVINNSSVTQNFVCNGDSVVQGGLIAFTGNASAGRQNTYTSNGVPGGQSSSSISFFDNTTAGSASFVANGSSLDAAGLVDFFGNSTASTGNFTLNGSTTGAGAGGVATFHEQSNAGNANLTTFGGVASGGEVVFLDAASAATCTITNNAVLPGGSAAGRTYFGGSSTGGNAAITNLGGTSTGTISGYTSLTDGATAGDAVITNEGGGADFGGGGYTFFYLGGNGGNATLISNGGATTNADPGFTQFAVGSNAGNATLIANSAAQRTSFNGGQIFFSEDSDGGTARVILSGNGSLNVTNHDFTPITVGSVEGNGNILISSRELVAGSNNLSTTFSGRITDSGNHGTITKTGRGTWILTGSNKYTAGTFINGGKLVANNRTGSATGRSPVQVNKGTLAGGGTIVGTVTVGSGRGRAAEVSPGRRGENNSGILTILADLTFNSDGSYNFQVDSDAVASDSVVAAGVIIQSGAQFNPSDLGSSLLPIGTSFVALDNTSATPIAGNFANLPDTSTFTVGPNTFEVSYSGGDGNDLTLTVVP